MGRVISIERVALTHNSAAAYFLGNDMNLSSANSSASELISISLPLGTPAAAETVLAHVVTRTPYSIDVVVADAHGSSVVNSFPIKAGATQPAEHYQVKALGSLESYLSEHQDLTDAVLAADSQLKHGRLTIARAVGAMLAMPDTSAEFALAQAVRTSERCAALDAQVKSEVGALRGLYDH